MSRVVYRGPSGKTIQDPEPEFVRQLIQEPTERYWNEGGGGADIEYVDAPPLKRTILILPNLNFGFYLQYSQLRDGKIIDTWLSLNRDRLTEVAECCEEWFASLGLFVPSAEAAIAVEDFIRTGELSGAITWIQPSEIPPDGNW